MRQIPRDPSPDSTLALLREGYRFISNRCERHGSDVFETRIMLTRAICARGPEAAEVFYTGERFTRRNAMPRTALMLLQDRGSVATMDAEPHHARKRMFLSVMGPEAIARLVGIMAEEWQAYIVRWESMDQVVLFDQVREILCRAVCRWAGVPLAEPQVERRTEELASMYDEAGGLGPRTWRALLLRARTERWARDVIDEIRAGGLDPPEDSVAHVFAWHRDLEGNLLDRKTAAVELINILRPTVAISRFIGFAALALHQHPEARRKLRSGSQEDFELFVHEVRRFYPFFPFVGGRARTGFDWDGIRIDKGQWMLLDIYGTNRHPAVWEDAESFRPERFREWDGSAFDFIPQGGGDHHTDHRCAGEWVTIALMKRAVQLLATAMEFRVPPQDLSMNLARIPAIPRSRLIISHVRQAR